MKRIYFPLMFPALISITMFSNAQTVKKFMYQDINLPIEQRVDWLVSQMTLEEKIGQMVYTAPAIDRLGVPAYNWWNECLHGIARNGYATVFPQSIMIAGSWDKDLIHQVATAISDEARAKHQEMVRRGKRGIYQGLTFWSPNINIFRDPRWGRGQETYGEDPYLTGQLGVQFVKGLQGDDPEYLKVVATAKHYAVHSGPEPLRHRFNAQISDLECGNAYPALSDAIKRGIIRESDIDIAVKRLFTARFKLGMFDPDDNFSIRWTGYLVPPVTGTYAIGCWEMPLQMCFSVITIPPEGCP